MPRDGTEPATTPSVLLLTGDAVARLRGLPDASVHACVTSPPYFGLRRYGGEGEIGGETTPKEFVERLVEVFHEAKRILRDDGTLWLVLGDSYHNLRTWKNGGQPAQAGVHKGVRHDQPEEGGSNRNRRHEGIKDGDLMMIPHMVAFALRTDGWYLRSTCVWVKGSVMPESVTNRPSSAHEYVFMLTKTRNNFYDLEGVKEVSTMKPQSRLTPRAENPGTKYEGLPAHRRPEGSEGGGTRQMRNTWEIDEDETQPLSDVFRINPEPIRDAHYAAFPTRLVSRMIQASTSEYGACANCNAPYRRIVEKGEPDEAHRTLCGADSTGAYDGTSQKDYATAGAQDASATKARILAGMRVKRTVGWAPTCGCDPFVSGIVPCVVLDCFSGSGTSGLSSVRLGRDYLGIDLNPAYHDIAVKRLTDPKGKCLNSAGERLAFRTCTVETG